MVREIERVCVWLDGCLFGCCSTLLYFLERIFFLELDSMYLACVTLPGGGRLGQDAVVVVD
jgi:hypothetical protein